MKTSINDHGFIFWDPPQGGIGKILGRCKKVDERTNGFLHFKWSISRRGCYGWWAWCLNGFGKTSENWRRLVGKSFVGGWYWHGWQRYRNSFQLTWYVNNQCMRTYLQSPSSLPATELLEMDFLSFHHERRDQILIV